MIRAWLLVSAAALSCAAFAESYTIDWSTVDGGGVSYISNGTYTLGGTIGQPDAGTLDNGTYNLVGGFWGVVRSVPAPSIAGSVASQNPVKTGTPLDFTVSVTQATGLPLTFSWEFGDGGTGSSIVGQ